MTYRANPRPWTAALAAARAAVGKPDPYGVDMCAHTVAEWYGWGHSGGTPNQIAAQHRAAGILHYPGFAGQAPAGALVLYLTSSGTGHIALSAGGGLIVSTDLPNSGGVGLVPVLAPCHAWGQPAPVWSLPVFPAAIAPSGPLSYPPAVQLYAAAPRVVHMSNLHPGATNSDVRTYGAALQAELARRGARVSSADVEVAAGHYGPQLLALCASWQVDCGFSGANANGYAGLTTTRRLGLLHGFTVAA